MHVFVFLRLLVETQERQDFKLVIGHRQVEAVAETANVFERQFLLLVRDVHPFARLAHAIALDRLGKDQCRLPLVFDGGLEGGENLEDVVTTAIQFPHIGIGPVGDEFA